jgi:heme exporter protein A
VTNPPTSASVPAPALRVAALACRRGERVLFRGLGFELAAGQVLWLRGANGRGKTSLLRLLAGLSSPEAGQIERGAALVYIAHANALKDDLTALESLRFLARLQGLPHDDAALLAALRRFGVDKRRNAPVRTLSQGQRRRVALARLALSPAGSVWVLDEPFDALDTDGIAALNGLLSHHVQAGGAVVLTSHQALTLTEPAPRVLQLDELAA